MGDVEPEDNRGRFEKALVFGASCSLFDGIQCFILTLLGNHCEIMIPRHNLTWCLQTLELKKIKTSAMMVMSNGDMMIMVKKKHIGLVKMVLKNYVHYLRG